MKGKRFDLEEPDAVELQGIPCIDRDPGLTIQILAPPIYGNTESIGSEPALLNEEMVFVYDEHGPGETDGHIGKPLQYKLYDPTIFGGMNLK